MAQTLWQITSGISQNNTIKNNSLWPQNKKQTTQRATTLTEEICITLN